MEKENGDGGNDAGGKATQESLLDAASLFGAYWGRDGSGGGSGGAAAQAQAAQAALFGFGGARYPPPTTLGVAANQAASLGLHPAASAAWWSMASHLAAQDYLARLQASGLSFPPMGDPYSALSALSGGMSMGKQPSKGNKGNKTERSGRNSSSSVGSSASTKDKSPATSSAGSQSNMRSSYGFPKTSSPSTMHSTSQASLSSLASLNSLVSASHQSNKACSTPKHSRKASTAKGSSVKDRDLALLRGDLMLAQAAAQGAYHAAVAAAKGGKNSNPLFNNPFGMGGSDKDRHSGLDSMAGLPHTILSDPASVLGGVRLPPDTEIIKYTSSIQGSKASSGSGSNRGRKKTISLDPPHVSVLPSTLDRLDRTSGLPSKRQKMDLEYGGSGGGPRSSVEVIRLPSRPQQGAALPSPTPFSLSDYAGLSKELLQSIANQSGLSLAALERELAGATSSGINVSAKSSNSSVSAGDAPLDLGISSKGLACDDDAPLNLSLKPSSSASTQASDALSRLTSLSSSLNAGATHTDRISRRKPGAKPRRVLPESESHITADSPRPKSSGSEDSESVGGWGSAREGRPRNLGRGVSKPKKNTVASLLAQSRALGLRPALAHQLLAETDIEKLKAALGEAGASTDSECPSDSGPSDSDASDATSTRLARRAPHDAQLRLPLALGWKRSTVIRGLSRSGCIKGEVSYTPPEPQAHLRIKSAQELNVYLEQYPCPPLTRDNFSYSARVIMGNYLQPGLDANDTITIGEAEITKRLEEARALAALSGAGGRPTPPPPVDRRIELARQQQAARDARRDASARGREQARLARELERSEKAEMAKREKEARNQQMIEHIYKNRTQLSIQPLPQTKQPPDGAWKTPEIVMGPASKPAKNRVMAPISLTLIPVTGLKPDAPVKTIHLDQTGWKEEIEEYNALDKMKDFAEKAEFDLPKKKDLKYNFDLTIVKTEEKPAKARKLGSKSAQEQNYDKLVQSYSRINEFIKGCDWTTAILKSNTNTTNPTELEQRYLDAKNEYMSQFLHLRPNLTVQRSVLPKEKIVEVIDLSEDEVEMKRLTDLIRNVNAGSPYSIGQDGALSISVQPPGKTKDSLAKKRKQEEMERQKMEEQSKRQQEREMKRQQAVLMKEQERERRRQHTTLVRQLDIRRRWEERERRKHQNLMDRLLAKEKKLQVRRKEMELLAELRRPQEDSTLSDQKPLPTLNRIPGLKLPGQAMADILQVFEFIHNFGQTLGFDMESVPTLNTLQMALLSDCCAEAEEDLMSVLTHLLVCSIEDPGIPHPGRHTTLLGQALRMGDITPANISEVLRIYLYANATGEVKALTGINQERERERRVADHHQTDAEMQSTCHNARNQIYYEHLHLNPTYRLSEALRDKPFLALCPTTKARILAFLCDELLQNKAVLRQIDASLEHLNQLKKERYLMDMKIRKVRVLHQRKVRAEQAEKQQALALERMQRLVEESTAGPNSPHNDEDPPPMAPPSVPERDFKEPPSKESSPCKDSETASEGPEDHATDQNSSPLEKESSVEKDVSPSKEGSRKNSISKELLNNNKDEGSPTEGVKDKDSMMGDEPLLSDVESEGTQPEEDEDKNLSSEELSRKLDKLLRQSEQQLQQLTAGAHSLRASSYGQDRYWRRYWSLGKCGGIFVEGMESAQPELLSYQQYLETQAKLRSERQEEHSKKRKVKGRKGQKEKKSADTPPTHERESKELDPSEPPTKTEDQIKSELELKNIKSELNLSDHTQIIKYEPNLKGHCKLEGSPIKMEEKYIQQKQNKDELDMLDIEDSIPTAFLVQKPSLNKPMFAGQIESMDKPQEVIKVENPAAKSEMDSRDQNMISDDQKDAQMVNNLEELRKMAEAMAQSQKEEPKTEEMEEKPNVKEEKIDHETAHAYLYTKMMEGRWFSILRKERSLLTNIQSEDKISNANENCSPNIPLFFENQQTCSEVIQCQGHKWDVSNNLHLLNDPSLFTLNSMVTSAQVPVHSVYADSSLTMSGIEQEALDASLIYRTETDELQDQDEEQKEENDVEKEVESARETSEKVRGRNSMLNPLGLLNFNALSTYVTCDSPPPIQMSLEEQEQLELCKSIGLPKKVDGNYVPKELRHGWWRITDPDTLKDLTQSLHVRGVRERELHAAFLSHLSTSNNKLHIDKGDMLSTELSISHLDRVIAQNGGFPCPDAPHAYSLKTARRLDSATLEQVEQLEERVAAASLQVKGWRPTRSPSSPAEELGLGALVGLARGKLAALEANIERRYLKPPLGQSTGDAGLGAVLQAEAHPAPSPAQAPHTPEKNADGSAVHEPKADGKGVPRGLATWRDAVSRSQTSAQLSMVLQALEGSIAWDKSIMKANCQFCQSGDNDDKLLLCDGCDKGYHTYCFKPKMDKIPDGDWYCWECVNKARGEKVCIVCGGGASGGGRGRLLPCTLCARAYHQLCHYPPLNKSPRGKWYCVNCIAKAPPKKPRSSGKKKDCRRDQNASMDSSDQHMVPSPAPSHASTSTTADDCPSQLLATPEKQPDMADGKMDSPPPPAADPENGLNHHSAAPEYQEPEDEGPPPEKRRMLQYHGGNGTLDLNHEDSNSDDASAPPIEREAAPETPPPPREREKENTGRAASKKDKNSKKQQKELQPCRNLLDEMELHRDSWPFLLPVNTKLFPTYKKVIRAPMDLSTIKRKLHDGSYKSKEDFANDVRQIFTNCEVFNEDESPVGQAGHGMRRFFEERWSHL